MRPLWICRRAPHSQQPIGAIPASRLLIPLATPVDLLAGWLHPLSTPDSPLPPFRIPNTRSQPLSAPCVRRTMPSPCPGTSTTAPSCGPGPRSPSPLLTSVAIAHLRPPMTASLPPPSLGFNATFPASALEPQFFLISLCLSVKTPFISNGVNNPALFSKAGRDLKQPRCHPNRR